MTPLNKVKIVILGQDPYYKHNQANGLAFSVPHCVSIPPSLFNIYKEISNNYNNFVWPKHGFLKCWAEQGVLLLNTILTVEKGKANSHVTLGWEKFTDHILKIISDNCKNIIFLLWGKQAQKKIKIIDYKKHKILCSAHPSPLSAHLGFFGCKHFIKANNLLKKWGKKTIDWNVI